MIKNKLFNIEFPLFIYVLSVILFSFHSENFIISYLSGVLLAVWFVVDKLIRKDFVIFGFTIYHTIFMAFLFLCSFGLIANPGGFERFLTVVQIFLLSIIVTDIVVIKKGLDAIKLAVISGCVYACFIVSLQQGSEMIYGNVDRVGSTLQNPNAFALALIVGMIFSFHEIITENKKFNKLRNILSVMLILWFGYYIIYYTGSRKGIILLFFINIMIFVYIFIYSKINQKIFVLFSFPIIEMILIYFLAKSPYFSRMRNLFVLLSGGSVSEGSMDVRTAMLLRAFDLWRQRPFWGWGIDQYRLVSGFNTYSHNNISEIIVNNGLIGFLFYYGMFFVLFLSIFKNITKQNKIIFWVMTGLIVLLMNDFGMVSYYSKIHWILFSTLVATIKINETRDKIAIQND